MLERLQYCVFIRESPKSAGDNDVDELVKGVAATWSL